MRARAPATTTSTTSRTAIRPRSRGCAGSRPRTCGTRATPRWSRHPGILAVLKALWGPSIRFDVSKLNLKAAGYGAPVEWHQDWAFYPHTNDDLAAVGIMIDDVDDDQRPADGDPGQPSGADLRPPRRARLLLRRDRPGRGEVDFSRAVKLDRSAPARSRSITRGPSTARRPTPRAGRGACCCTSTAPPTPGRSWACRTIEAYRALLLCGAECEPRLAPAPVRLPLPPAAHQGSIYENQRTRQGRFFQTAAELEPAAGD